MAAGGLENWEDQPGPLSTEERLATVRRAELRRIWSTMSVGSGGTYSPESDPEVHRWHGAQQGRQERESNAAAGWDSGPVRYRIVAECAAPERPGDSLVTHYVSGRSVEEAVAEARGVLGRPDGVYGEPGVYRVVEVVEEGPFSGPRQQEVARRRYLTAIVEAAKSTVQGRELEDPDADLLRRLDDFFTRALVSPGPRGGGVQPRAHQAAFGWSSEPPGIEHASEPGRALAVFLLAYLDHHGLSVTSQKVER
ncbi:hypothetical protein [Streptomyces finlayi]|uniref:hypothetical protein n=1 Tax=Streptomyces finlayi TaxID=67296 RepID=UPI0016727AD3|nr:hypothetical protein [Streptomyces finlayi]